MKLRLMAADDDEAAAEDGERDEAAAGEYVLLSQRKIDFHGRRYL